MRANKKFIFPEGGGTLQRRGVGMEHGGIVPRAKEAPGLGQPRPCPRGQEPRLGLWCGCTSSTSRIPSLQYHKANRCQGAASQPGRISVFCMYLIGFDQGLTKI